MTAAPGAERGSAGLFHRRIDPASLAAFRIAFGTLMCAQAVRYLVFGHVDQYFVEPDFHFTWMGFEWVRPLPQAGMYAVFVLQAAAAAGVALGLLYRASAALLWLTFTYEFMLEDAHYLNHHYLICLLSFLFVWVPAHTTFSLDARRRPELRGAGLPLPALLLLRFQVGIVYVYAGVAKINADWMAGNPLHTWLANRSHYPVIGPLLAEEWLALSFAWASLLLDLFVVPLLLWRRTRAAAFALALVFHLLNALLFTIGVFPWMMIAATTLFFPPGWPRRLLRRGASRRWPETSARPWPARRAARLLLCAWVVIQLLLPLRHWLYPGDVRWTEEGHRFSWRMLLRQKQGQVRFVARDPESGRMWVFHPEHVLEPWQLRRVGAHPDMILQYARYVARRLREEEGVTAEVRAVSRASVNGRPFQPLVDPDTDLARQPRTPWHWPWIVPLRHP